MEAIYVLACEPLSKAPRWFYGLHRVQTHFDEPLRFRAIFTRTQKLAKRYDSLCLVQSYADFLQTRGHEVIICILDPDPKLAQTPKVAASTPIPTLIVHGLKNAHVTRNWHKI